MKTEDAIVEVVLEIGPEAAHTLHSLRALGFDVFPVGIEAELKEYKACVATANHDLVSIQADRHAAKTLLQRRTAEIDTLKEQLRLAHEDAAALRKELRLADERLQLARGDATACSLRLVDTHNELVATACSLRLVDTHNELVDTQDALAAARKAQESKQP